MNNEDQILEELKKIREALEKGPPPYSVLYHFKRFVLAVPKEIFNLKI